MLGSGPGVAEEAELPLTPLAERALLAAEEMARQLGGLALDLELEPRWLLPAKVFDRMK